LFLAVVLKRKWRASTLSITNIRGQTKSHDPPLSSPNSRVHPTPLLAWTADATLSSTSRASPSSSPTHSSPPLSPSSFTPPALLPNPHDHPYHPGGGGRTNNSSEESTYRLLVQQTDHPVMPLRHVGDGGSPPWSLPLRAPPAKKKTRQGGGGESGSRNSSKKSNKQSNKKGGGGGDGDGNGHEDDGISRRGCWEELFDAVNGTKIWYNTVTRKKTSKDPFW